jgi:LysM repeat protein
MIKEKLMLFLHSNKVNNNMKQNSIKELPRLDVEKFENIFNVYQEKNGMFYYNLLQTIEFPQNLPNSLFSIYTIQYGDTWPYISYKTLKSPNLWWIILLVNGISNPITSLVVGENIKIPGETIVKEVISQIGK